MLEIKNLQKGYNGQILLQNINLSVDRGEIHGIIGSNGSGKTTLLKCATGIYKPAGGTVQYDGKEIYANPGAKSKVALVTAQLDFEGLNTVKEIGRRYGVFYETFSKDKFAEMLERFQIRPRQSIGTLSVGQKAKVFFSLAIAQQPEYLIMDEPESGMDVEGRRLFREILIEEVEKSRMGVLFASHDLMELERMCDTVTMMEAGEIFAQKPVYELMESVQKWKCVLPEQISDEQLYEKMVYPGTKIGNLWEVYTIGEPEDNLRILQKLGIADSERQQISLEEIYTILRDRFRQRQGNRSDEKVGDRR